MYQRIEAEHALHVVRNEHDEYKTRIPLAPGLTELFFGAQAASLENRFFIPPDDLPTNDWEPQSIPAFDETRAATQQILWIGNRSYRAGALFDVPQEGSDKPGSFEILELVAFDDPKEHRIYARGIPSSEAGEVVHVAGPPLGDRVDLLFQLSHLVENYSLRETPVGELFHEIWTRSDRGVLRSLQITKAPHPEGFSLEAYLVQET